MFRLCLLYNSRMRSIILPVLSIALLLVVAIVVIFYARGYRFNTQEQVMSGTGLLVATSKPDGAQVFVDGELKSATNTTLSLTPGKHDVEIRKEGFQPWKKEMNIFEEVVSQTDAVLFPRNPGLSPLTNSGVLFPQIAPDGSAVAFVKRDPEATIAAGLRRQEILEQTGIFVLDLENRPLAFANNPRRIVAYAALPADLLDQDIIITWSPDKDQLLVQFETTAYLLNNANNPVPAFAPSSAETIELWEEQAALALQSKIEALPKELILMATSSAEIISFSPNETKFLYRGIKEDTVVQVIDPPLIGVNSTQEIRQIKPGNLYTYDLKEDRNYLVGPESEINVSWFPTSSHLVYIEEDKLKIMSFDTTNKTTLFAGAFDPDFVTPWPDGSSVVILTNLNPDASDELNLYAVKLR